MMMKRISWLPLALLLGACVTVNVYFPASAAERAADRFIRDVYDAQEPPGAAPAPAPEAPKTTPEASDVPTSQRRQWPGAQGFAALFDWLIPVARAQQPDITISTPAVNALKSAMERRHAVLAAYYGTGAVGMSGDGLIVLRDPALVPLAERNMVKKLVADENADRLALYGEVARANGHPEWEADIRGIFAQRWVANAPAGWWHQVGGAWQQK